MLQINQSICILVNNQLTLCPLTATIPRVNKFSGCVNNLPLGIDVESVASTPSASGCSSLCYPTRNYSQDEDPL